MSTGFASAGLTAGQLNAIVKKLGGHDMALRFLRDELSVSETTRSWREEDGVIYFSVKSDGTTGENWITRLKSKGFHVNYYVEQALRSSDFKSTSGVTTEVAVLKSMLFEDSDRITVLKSMLFEDSDRITKKIHAEADKRKLSKPNAEVACLIREKFTDKEIEAMGLWYIVAMHKPINDFGGGPYLLYVSRDDVGRWLYACSNDRWPDHRWSRIYGFAFAVSQVGSQS